LPRRSALLLAPTASTGIILWGLYDFVVCGSVALLLEFSLSF
jgi:hypothetical protein